MPDGAGAQNEATNLSRGALRSTIPWARRATNVVRGLRFRLTVSYVLFFSVLLVGIGLLFRQTLRSQLDDDVRVTLEEEWGAAKAYLRIENKRPIWVADSSDPEEAYIVERLRRVYLLTDSTGYLLEHSETYDSLGIDPPQEIQRIVKSGKTELHERRDKSGIPYLIKAGEVPSTDGEPYFFALGRSLEANERTVDTFMGRYFLLLPALIALTCFLGWILAGRAVRPVNQVAQAAEGVTGSNLSLRIPKRGADDELDHLIDSFNQMTERLSHSFEQIRRFSTDVSHELRTPLTAIRGQLEVALFTAQTTEQFRDAMVNALEDVEKLSSIVRALLLLSQAESGQLALQKTSLDLGAIAEDVVDQFQIPAEEKGVELSVTTLPGTSAFADKTQVERLFSNLVSNAVKYTPRGGTIQVRVGPDSAHQSWARVEVADTGVGIPAENLSQIFDRFYRVRNAETNLIQGLGLGLSFVAWIVSAHGGSINVESKPGEGSRFIVHLPSAPPASVTPSPEPATVTV
ncbi:MAG: ATP-binding protein [Bryobacteraceae bacterium]